MALDLARLAAPSNAAPASANQKPSAQVWLNLGYDVEVTNADGTIETRFVSLPVGIPVDTTDPVEMRGRNADYLAFTKRRNELLETLQAAAKGLKPGEETKVSGLQIQIRRVADPVTDADVNADESRYTAPALTFS